MFLLICLYFDTKYRIIPNKVIGSFFLFSCLLKTLELIIFRYVVNFYLLIIQIIFISMLSLMYFISFIKGGDLKVLIILILMIPHNIILYFLLNFFIINLFFVLVMILYHLLFNVLSKDRKAFTILKNIHKFRTFLMRLTFKMVNITDISEYNKNIIYLKYPDLVYNSLENRLQIMVKNIFPFLIPLFFSYIVILVIIVLDIH